MATFISNKHLPGPETSRKNQPAFDFRRLRPQNFKRLLEPRPSARTLSDFFDHLAVLLASGVTLLAAVDFIAASARSAAFKAALLRIADGVRAGAAFSAALSEEPALFDRVAVGMICAAESSGRLEPVSAELAVAYNRQAEARQQMMQALAYPVFVATAGLVTVAVLLLFVIPKVAVVFEMWDTPLPLMTRALIGTSSFLRHGGFLILLLPAVFLPLFLRSRRRQIEKAAQKVFEKTPFVKEIFFLNDFVRLTRTWGMLLRSGVPVLEAIQSSRDVLANDALRQAVGRMGERVLKGERLQEAVQDEAWIPEFAKNFLRIGEETGTLDESFEKVARFYDRQLQGKLKLVATFLEPAFILIVGVSVGVLVMSLLLPIFEMSLVVR